MERPIKGHLETMGMANTSRENNTRSMAGKKTTDEPTPTPAKEMGDSIVAPNRGKAAGEEFQDVLSDIESADIKIPRSTWERKDLTRGMILGING